MAVISIATISTVSSASGTQVRPIMPSSVKTMIDEKRADHIDLAMGEIDHANDAVDHAVADRDQPVHRPQRQAIDELLQEVAHRFSFPLRRGHV